MPLKDEFEQVAQTAELNAKLARTMVKAMRNTLEIIVLSSRWALQRTTHSFPMRPSESNSRASKTNSVCTVLGSEGFGDWSPAAEEYYWVDSTSVYEEGMKISEYF